MRVDAHVWIIAVTIFVVGGIFGAAFGLAVNGGCF
jgi:hypothetical protein